MNSTIAQKLEDGFGVHAAGQLHQLQRLYGINLRSKPAHHNLRVLAVSVNIVKISLSLSRLLLKRIQGTSNFGSVMFILLLKITNYQKNRYNMHVVMVKHLPRSRLRIFYGTDNRTSTAAGYRRT